MTDTPLFQSPADYINALIDDAEVLTVEEMAGAGRSFRRATRKIGAEWADKAVTPEIWESRLKGDADEQTSFAVQFLHAVQIGLVNAMDEMGVRR